MSERYEQYKIGDYHKKDNRIEKIIYGGNGIIYIAKNDENDHRYAIKSFPKSHQWHEGVLKQFHKEALVWITLLPHPNIVSASFIENISNVPFLQMEYLQGGNLREYMHHHKPDLGEFLRITIQLAEGVRFLHAHEIIHSDLKPENVLFSDEFQLKITDFGLALTVQNLNVFYHRDPNAEYKSNDNFMFGGTLPYMAPEYFSSEQVSKSSDIYAFGVIMYEIATGRHPFQLRSSRDIIKAHKEKIPIEPHLINNHIPESLSVVIMKCLAKRATERFNNIEQLMNELVNIANGLNILNNTKTNISDKELEVRLTCATWSNRGFSFKQLGDYQQAIRCYDMAVSIATTIDDEFLANYNLAKVYLTIRAHEEFEDTISLIDQISDLVRDRQLVKFLFVLKADAAYSKFDLSNAVTILESALLEFPNDYTLLIKLMRYSYTRFVDPNHILNLARRTEAQYPWDKEHFNVHYGAVFSDEYGNDDIALSLFNRSLEINENYLLGIYNIGVLAARRHQYDLAITYFDSVLKMDNDHAWSLHLRGLCLYKCSRINQALADWVRLCDKHPEFMMVNIVKDIRRNITNGSDPKELIEKIDDNYLKRYQL